LPMFCSNASGGEILSPPENSVPQTIVFHNKKSGRSGEILWTTHRKKNVMFLPKYYLDRNNTIFFMLPTQ
jgi:hypothetical protein